MVLQQLLRLRETREEELRRKFFEVVDSKKKMTMSELSSGCVIDLNCLKFPSVANTAVTKPFSLSFFQKTLSHGGRKSLRLQVMLLSVLGRTRVSGRCEFDL